MEEGPMPNEDANTEVVGADAAHAATVETVEAIEEAAKVNDDPAVAEALDDAAVKADAASTRTGWLRRLLHRRHS
jgi:5,10-methenyltetrahydromethanopterin hydrogenase